MFILNVERLKQDDKHDTTGTYNHQRRRVIKCWSCILSLEGTHYGPRPYKCASAFISLKILIEGIWKPGWKLGKNLWKKKNKWILRFPEQYSGYARENSKSFVFILWSLFCIFVYIWIFFLHPPQPAKLQEKQCGGVYFWLFGIAYWMPIQQKLPPPVLLFSDFAGWDSFIVRLRDSVLAS